MASAAQTTYSRDFTRGREGQACNSDHMAEPFTNGSGGSLTAGVLVAQKSATEGSADYFNAPSASPVGVTMFTLAHDPSNVTNDAIYGSTDTMNVMTEGEIFVKVEQAVAIGDGVYARHTSDGASNTVLGKFRKDGDSGKAMQLKGAYWVKGASSGGIAVLHFSRADQSVPGDLVEITAVNASVSATTTSAEYKTRSDRYFKVESAQYVNPTGLAADASNYFTIEAKNGSTSLASWSTLSTAQGALTANTFAELVLTGTAANLVLAPNTTISQVLTKTGTQTLPAGKLVIHGRYL